ncbi:MAG: CDP-glucose 4,6-dehydratase [Deltaproteobacteria bacterium]|nr:CDP-glucose 4,6-dehydratase [Deltaproteobacteria bacterium]
MTSLSPSPDFWRDREVLVTGHTGFKGSWLCLWLANLGAKIHGYALPPVFNQPGEIPLFVSANVRSKLAAHWEADIRDSRLLAKVWNESGATVLFHLAAQPLVRESYLSPYETFEVNTLGTVAVLEALRLANRPAAAVLVTTDKCYENLESVWSRRETDPLGGQDPYSASKSAAELTATAYRSSFFQAGSLAESPLVRLATARAGNVIGGGDWAIDRLAPDLARSLLGKKEAIIRNPRAIRPWQHVLEPLMGYIVLAERLWNEPENPSWRSAWNFGPDSLDLWPVSAVADAFCAAWGEGANWLNVSDPNAPYESSFLSLCIDKAVQVLGWKPRWQTIDAVERTALWYKNYGQTGFNAANACALEIQDYIAKSR